MLGLVVDFNTQILQFVLAISGSPDAASINSAQNFSLPSDGTTGGFLFVTCGGFLKECSMTTWSARDAQIDSESAIAHQFAGCATYGYGRVTSKIVKFDK